MVISVAILVGDAQSWLPELVQLAQKLRASGGFEKGVDLCVKLFIMIPLSSLNAQNCSGPVISPAAKERILGLIGSAEKEGGKVHLDGRNVTVPGYEHGNFIGPTIIEVGTQMRCYQSVFT